MSTDLLLYKMKIVKYDLLLSRYILNICKVTMTLRSLDGMRQFRMIVKNGNWKNNLLQNEIHVYRKKKFCK